MKRIALLLGLLSLTACQAPGSKNQRMSVTEGHLDTTMTAAESTQADIPPVVEQVPIVAVPEPAEPLQTFTVVATDLAASELLFALARDARLNLDIDPAIDGRVSINAIDQTLPQILQRIARQVALRYYLDGPNLVIEQDKPFTRVYRIDYLICPVKPSRRSTSPRKSPLPARSIAAAEAAAAAAIPQPRY